MKKLLSYLFFILISTQVFAEFRAEIHPSTVSLGQSFKLILTQENSVGTGVPDLTVLQKDFTIIGTERSVNYMVLNGKTQSASQWIIDLQPKKAGILTIPSIKLGSEESQSVTVKVQAHSNPQQTGNDVNNKDIYIETKVLDKKPYVNQQIIYTIKLYNSKRLMDANFQGPSVDNALLIPLGDANRYRDMINDTPYVVEEQHYAIYPQKSGSLIIHPPKFHALIYDLAPQKVEVSGKPIKLNIQPRPKKYAGKIWFPAKQVTLTEEYEQSSQSIKQGATITRTVTVQAIAAPAQLIPKLDFTKQDGFSIYPEKAKNRNTVLDGNLVGTATFKVTYLFDKTGQVHIPELTLSWFNTQTGKEEKASLPPRSFDIVPGEAQSKIQRPEQKKQSAKHAEFIPKPVKVPHRFDSWGWIFAIVFAFAWIITLALWLFYKKPSTIQSKKQYKNAIQELQQACDACKPTKARDALLHWARLYWPDATILNLSDVANLIGDLNVKKQVNALSHVIYRKEGRALWRGDALYKAIINFSKSKANKKSKNPVLPPINPF